MVLKEIPRLIPKKSLQTGNNQANRTDELKCNFADFICCNFNNKCLNEGNFPDELDKPKTCK